MKALLITFYLTFLFSSAFTQNSHLGKYCTADHYSKIRIEFLNDSSFNYFESGHYSSSVYGKGIFIISNDKRMILLNLESGYSNMFRKQ